MLSEPEEKKLTLKELTGKKALLNLYDEFTSSFIYRLKIGEMRKTLRKAKSRQ